MNPSNPGNNTLNFICGFLLGLGAGQWLHMGLMAINNIPPTFDTGNCLIVDAGDETCDEVAHDGE